LQLRRGTKLKVAALELRAALATSVLDPVVITCRAHPSLARELFSWPQLPSILRLEFRSIEDAEGIRRSDSSLTPREREVLALLARGYTNAEIANELVIAEVTAKVHVRNIIRKLGVRSRTEAAISVFRDPPI
jgi:two-component system nitrate/nitrite response regulator NarL